MHLYQPIVKKYFSSECKTIEAQNEKLKSVIKKSEQEKEELKGMIEQLIVTMSWKHLPIDTSNLTMSYFFS